MPKNTNHNNTQQLKINETILNTQKLSISIKMDTIH